MIKAQLQRSNATGDSTAEAGAVGEPCLFHRAVILGGNGIMAAMRQGRRWVCGLLRAALRLSALGFLLTLALADAAIVRLMTPPTAKALARGRGEWLRRWSALACSVLGLYIELEGFVPPSGLVVIDQMNLVDLLLLSAVAPSVFIVDMEIRRRPLVGWLTRFGGAIFRDRRRFRDIARTNLLIERALKRCQRVVLFRSCGRRRDQAAKGPPSALLEAATDARYSLTAAAIRRGIVRARNGNSALALLMQPSSCVTIAFHPPSFHTGTRKQLARQVWREVQALG